MNSTKKTMKFDGLSLMVRIGGTTGWGRHLFEIVEGGYTMMRNTSRVLFEIKILDKNTKETPDSTILVMMDNNNVWLVIV